jgi:hypothetical protein
VGGVGNIRSCVSLSCVVRFEPAVRDRRAGVGETNGELLSMPLKSGLEKRSRRPTGYEILGRKKLTKPH